MKVATIALVGLATSACMRSSSYRCDEAADCMAGGVPGRCEADGYCSVPSAACPDGWAYGESAGDRAGTCVGDDPPPDGPAPDAPDAPPAGGDRQQLLIVGIQGWQGDAEELGWRVLTRTVGTPTWSELAETSPPNWNCDAVAWADALGGSGGDGLPEALVRCWGGPYVVRLTRDDRGDLLGRTPLSLEPGGGENSERGNAAWLDREGDGDLDVLRGHPDLAFHENLGGTFALRAAIATGPHGLAIGNWDDDPEPELASAGPGGVVVRERGNGEWTPITIDASATAVRSLLWCDHRGDGHPDLFVASAGFVRLYANDGVATGGNWLDVAAPVAIAGATGDDFAPMVCADVDGDQRDDLIYRGYDGVHVVPHGTATRHEVGTDLDPTGLALADVDDDGRVDLITTHGGRPGRVEVRRNLSASDRFTFGAPTLLVETGDGALAVSVTTIARPAPVPPI